MLAAFCTRFAKPLGLSKGMACELTAFPPSDDLDKILADRIKNKFRPKVEQRKVNFKKVKVEQNHITTDLVELGGEYNKFEAQNKTSDISLCSFTRGPCSKEEPVTVSLVFGENTNIGEIEFVLAAQNFVIGINYRLLSDTLDDKDEWKQAM